MNTNFFIIWMKTNCFVRINLYNKLLLTKHLTKYFEKNKCDVFKLYQKIYNNIFSKM